MQNREKRKLLQRLLRKFAKKTRSLCRLPNGETSLPERVPFSGKAAGVMEFELEFSKTGSETLLLR